MLPWGLVPRRIDLLLACKHGARVYGNSFSKLARLMSLAMGSHLGWEVGEKDGEA